ncbi:hypothetical protein [Streptomyces sp. NPDC060001]|uniref:hypothetical protein n=1 Tax=Streptomyces sp. NPDC060001 TaxID=3347032 RepID=UPI0036753EBE
MPPTPELGSVRSAAVVNEEIRQLMTRRGGWLKPEDRGLYEELRAEWADAVRAEIVEAA